MKIEPDGARARRFAPPSARPCANKGMIFVGIDVIGDWLTEINVTSPTGIQEIARFDGVHLEQCDLGQHRGEARRRGLIRSRLGNNRVIPAKAGNPRPPIGFPAFAGDEGGRGNDG